RADIDEGRRLISAGWKAVDGGSIEALIEADLQFHMWMYRVAGNPLLVETMTLYWNHLRRAMGEILRQQPERETIWNEHAAILAATIEPDPAGAGEGAVAHVREGSARVAELIPAAGSSEPTSAADLVAAGRRRAR